MTGSNQFKFALPRAFVKLKISNLSSEALIRDVTLVMTDKTGTGISWMLITIISKIAYSFTIVTIVRHAVPRC